MIAVYLSICALSLGLLALLISAEIAAGVARLSTRLDRVLEVTERLSDFFALDLWDEDEEDEAEPMNAGELTCPICDHADLYVRRAAVVNVACRRCGYLMSNNV